MKTPQTQLVAACVLCFAGAAQAQFEPDADTAALYHFDTQTAEGTTPDSGPNGLDGTLEGAVPPTLAPAIPAGYGFAYDFDGIDRGANNSRINMGTDPRLGFRGHPNWTLDVVVSVTHTLADDGYFRGIVCRAGPEGVDYALSYSSWTNPTQGPEHEFWFTTSPAAGSDGLPPEYTYASSNYTGFMEVGQSYAVRVTVTNGVIAITVNGAAGNGALYPTQTGTVIPPNAPPQGGELTVGDACPEDNVVKPSELQIDELRISNVARSDLPLPPLLPPLGLEAILAPVPPPVIVPLRASPAFRF